MNRMKLYFQYACWVSAFAFFLVLLGSCSNFSYAHDNERYSAYVEGCIDVMVVSYMQNFQKKPTPTMMQELVVFCNHLDQQRFKKNMKAKDI